MRKLLIVTYKELLIYWFFLYDLFYPICSRFIGTSASEYIYIGIFILLLIIAISKNRTSINIDTVILYIFCISSFFITLIIHPEYHEVMFNVENRNIFDLIFSFHRGIIGYLIIRLEKDDTELLNILKVCAVITWITYSLKTLNGVNQTGISIYTGQLETSNYNQAYGFSFLFVAIIFLYFYLRENNKIYLVPCVISTIQILMYAARTTILCYIVYIIIYILFENKNKEYRNIKRFVACLVLLIVGIMITSSWFLSIASDLVSSLGVSSKIIDSLLDNSISLDGGRIRMYTKGLELIKTNPLGLGIYSDRYYFDVYVHNFFIEVLMDYGWIIGSIIFMILGKIVIRMITAKDNIYRSLFFIFFSLVSARLILSYSFWQDTNFWFMLGIYATYSTVSKQRIEMI